ncbi:MAG TPA: DsrE/DsrF/DrsH-like family protein [Spirochaetia bacterium]|nr:DsrE/DsrF/DrsH-like family protein [Spirochaetia bacterium]
MSVDVDKAMADLRSKVESMPGAENKLTMVVMSGELDKHLAAMIIATGAAAMGMKVILFFTFWGTAALRAADKKGRGKNFMGKMFGMMLPKGRNKLVLSKMNMAGMGTAMLKGLMKKKNVASLDQLYEVAAQLAVKIYICEMSMDLMGMKKEEMIDYPDLEVCGVATMLSHAKESAIQFFI